MGRCHRSAHRAGARTQLADQYRRSRAGCHPSCAAHRPAGQRRPPPARRAGLAGHAPAEIRAASVVHPQPSPTQGRGWKARHPAERQGGPLADGGRTGRYRPPSGAHRCRHPPGMGRIRCRRPDPAFVEQPALGKEQRQGHGTRAGRALRPRALHRPARALRKGRSGRIPTADDPRRPGHWRMARRCRLHPPQPQGHCRCRAAGAQDPPSRPAGRRGVAGSLVRRPGARRDLQCPGPAAVVPRGRQGRSRTAEALA